MSIVITTYRFNGYTLQNSVVMTSTNGCHLETKKFSFLEDVMLTSASTLSTFEITYLDLDLDLGLYSLWQASSEKLTTLS